MASTTKRKRPVEVVQCGDPWMNSSIKYSKPKKTRQEEYANSRKKASQDRTFDMKESFREVVDFGSTKFAGWQRKQFESSKVAELGGREQKNQKMPLKMLVGIRAKRAKIAALIDSEAKAAGIVLAKSDRLAVSGNKKKGKRDQNDRGLGEAFVRGGTLNVPRHTLEKMNISMRAKSRHTGGKGKGGGGKGGGKGGGGKGGKSRKGGKGE